MKIVLRITLAMCFMLITAIGAQPVGENTPIKCGVPFVLEALTTGETSLQMLSQLHRYSLQQVQWDSIVSPSGHFMLHYNTTEYDSIPSYDRNGNGTPDYLEFVAASFDRAWQVEVDSLGFNPPPDKFGNPLTIYPVYCGDPARVYNVPPNTYGVTGWDPSQDIPSLPGYNFPSEIWINTDFSFLPDYLYEHITGGLSGLEKRAVRDSLAIAVTAAHEFNHALQLGYRIWFEQNSLPDLWFIESSATYMEEVVADAVNDYYQYLPSFFNSTDKYLTREEGSGRIYGEVALHIMLGERFDKTITREIWQEITQQPALGAIRKVLQDKGSDLDSELQQLATWIFFTGNNAVSDRFFPEASNYPAPSMNVVSLNHDPETSILGSLPALSFQFYQVNLSSPNVLSALLSPQTSPQSWAGASFLFSDPFASFFPANIYATVEDAANLRAYLLVYSGGWSEDAYSESQFELRIRKTTTIATEGILVYPNIIRPEEDVKQITFANLPEEAHIEIFNSNGLHIASVYPESFRRVAFWNLLTKTNKTVGSGVYIYRVVSKTESHSGKIMIVR